MAQNGRSSPPLADEAPHPSNYPEAYSVSEAVRASNIGRTMLYAEIKAGRLKSFLLGRRRLILREDLMAWLREARDGGSESDPENQR